MNAKNERKSVFRPLTKGHILTSEDRENIKKVKEIMLDCEEKYRNHIQNCIICNS